MSFRKKSLTALALCAAIAFAAGGVHAGTFEDAMTDYRLGLYDAAFGRLEALADAGHPEAQFWVGAMWHKGRGTTQNFEKAHHYYHLAANRNSPDAQNNLGLLYRDGLGTPPDRVTALAWFALAAGAGSEVGRENRDRLAISLTAGQISRGQAIAEMYAKRLPRSPEVQLASLSDGPSPGMEYRSSGLTPPSALDEREVAVMAPTPRTAAVPLPPRPPVATAAARPVPETAIKARPVRSIPTPVVEEPVARVVAARTTGPETTAAAPAKAEPAVLTGSAAPAFGAGGYMVRLGYFRSAAGVAKIHRDLRARGLAATDAVVRIGHGEAHRIQVGPYATRAEAARAKATLDPLFRIDSRVVEEARDG